jgi:glucans biosynthesis protein
MHGGAPGSGAPKGNQNALKLGRYTRKAIARRRKQRRREREIIGLLRQLFRGRIQDDGSGKG